MLDLLDHGRDGGIEGGGAAGDERRDAAQRAGGGVADEEGKRRRAQNQCKEEAEESACIVRARVVLRRHLVSGRLRQWVRSKRVHDSPPGWPLEWSGPEFLKQQQHNGMQKSKRQAR